MKPQKHDIEKIAKHFSMLGDYRRHAPCGNGHINDTYQVYFSQGGTEIRYIVQRINHEVFKQPDLVMDNIIRVTTHIADKLREAGEKDVNRRVLTLIPARDGSLWYEDRDGNSWRAYVYVEGANAHDRVDSMDLASEAACAFGEFQKSLVDLPGGPLAETIPNFHNSRTRYDDFIEAVEEDRVGRACTIKADIDFVRERESMVDVLIGLEKAGKMEIRTTHNDTKINNVMIDEVSGKATCIMDLDTVMPGLALYDFGDLVRTTTISTAEDEPNLTKVTMRFRMYEALAKGYLSSADFLTDTEREHLAFSGKLITFTIGMRFLTDYLNGDVYFKTAREHHNLDRYRVQGRLVESIEEQESAMQDVADACRPSQ